MLLDTIKETAIQLATQLLASIAILIIGFKIVNLIEKKVMKSVTLVKMDTSLQSFVLSLTSISLKLLVLISAIIIAGVPMTTFVAILGAAGLAIGLALQGSLSNLAGGVLIIALRPFKVGDFIEGANHSGTVTEIGLFYTRLTTPDNRAIIIPNASISSSSVVNYGYFETRRLDLEFGVDYESDIETVKKTILATLEKDDKVLADPVPFVRLAEHADSALIFKVRVWVKTPDYWNLNFDLQEKIKEAFDANEISIPYPHLVIQNRKE